MESKVLVANRGLVFAIHDDSPDDGKTTNGTRITCSTFHPNTAEFIASAITDLNVTAEQIVQCSVIENSHTGTFAPCLLIERVNGEDDIINQGEIFEPSCSKSYQVLFFCPEKGTFSGAGSFSTSNSLTKSKIWLLNGPTICWEHDGQVVFVQIKPGGISKDFPTKRLPNHLWTSEHRVQWCDVINGDLILLATHSQQERNDNSSWFNFETAIAQRKWTLIKCPKRGIKDSHIVECNVPIIPDIYASIVTCLHISRSDNQNAIQNCTDFPESSSVLAATNHGQLLEFLRGKVHLVCDLPFMDTCKILTVARTDSPDLVLVVSQSGRVVCAVDRTTFKVCDVMNNKQK